MGFCRRSAVLFLTLAALAGLTGLTGCAAPGPADDGFKPVLRQAGKDVMWLPTSQDMVNKLLAAAEVTSKDIVYDLGAGDGVIPITAAKRFGSRAVGIEYDQKLADFARKNAQLSGVADKVKIIRGDIFIEDFSEATVVSMYLLPELNLQLRPTLMKMRPGTRIVSNTFDMQEWSPDQTVSSGETRGFLWIVPAPVEGDWEFTPLEGSAPAKLSLRQAFQQVGGTLSMAGLGQTVLGAQLRGNQLSFHFVGRDNIAQSVTGTVTADTFTGELTAYGQTRPVQAKRR
jgi:precorrin-6B methylase 2